jgi:predicted HTH transcriptional regulator
MLDDALIDYLIFHGREERNLEYKSSMNWKDIATKAKITKAAMAMSNISDGGYIVIGVTKNGEAYEPDGIQELHLDSFKQDDVMTWVNKYADPYVELTVVYAERDNKNFIIIDIMEFDQLPIVCKKPGQNLKSGDIFTRSRRKYETALVSSQTEIREILELAVDKQIRRLATRGYVTFAETVHPAQNDKQLFEQQGKELDEYRGIASKDKI